MAAEAAAEAATVAATVAASGGKGLGRLLYMRCVLFHRCDSVLLSTIFIYFHFLLLPFGSLAHLAAAWLNFNLSPDLKLSQQRLTDW